MNTEVKYLLEIKHEFEENLLGKWYPLVIDKKYGGYYSNIKSDWKLELEQEKMIVTQSRHIWLLSKAAELYNDKSYEKMALHGYQFLKYYMWDKEYGGFFQIRSRDGLLTSAGGWCDEKRAYGNAFAIYGLSALYKITNNTEVLKLATDTFYWIEKNAYDTKNKGYFQFLTREGKPFGKESETKTGAADVKETGYKDQNSSIHLLEAYTELYKVWPNPLLKERLTELLILIRDTIVNNKGSLTLFFSDDWIPISFQKASKEERESNYDLDHVSFGHDYETAFLMLEASHALGLENDFKTLFTSKKMLDHAIKYGWDKSESGFFDEGYYFEGEEKCSIIKDTKTWWPQAEGLNALLLFSKIFPDENIYQELFLKLWKYVNKYVIDRENKGWFWGSFEKEPYMVNEQKGNIWKAAYHDGRSLINCMLMSAENHDLNIKTSEKIKETNDFLEHWKTIAKSTKL